MKNLEYSSKSQAENGTDNTTVMTPLRVKQSILANSSASPQAVQSDWSEGDNTSPAYIRNKPTIPTLTSQLTNDSRFVVGGVYSYSSLISITSTSDPVYVSLVNDITNSNMFSIGDSNSANAPIYTHLNNNGDITIKYLDSRWWLITVNLTVNGTTVTETTDFDFLIKDLQINGNSQISLASGVANILTNSPYSSSNKIATMADIPSVTGNTYYFDGQNNQANVDMINEICTKFDNGEEIVFTGKFADGNINQVFEVPINITKYTTDTSFNNDSAFVSDPVFWFDPTSYDPTDPTSVPTIYYLTYALYLNGTWGNFTSVTTFRTHTMTPDAWGAKQDALVSGTNIKTINGNSLLGSGDLVIGTNNLAQTIQQSEFLTLTSGISVVHYNIFKLSNTISGTIVFQTTNVIGNANVELFNIKEGYKPSTYYYTFCGLGTDDWKVQRIGYFYLGSNGTGIVLDQNNSRDCKYAIINFNYQTS